MFVSFARDCYPPIIAQSRVNAVRRVIWVSVRDPLLCPAICSTVEQRRREDIDRLAEVLEGALSADLEAYEEVKA